MATGFSLVVRRPYLVFVPILVDIWAWYGPGVSAGPLIRQWASKFLSALTAGPLTPEQMLGINTRVTETAEALSQWNVLGLLGWQVPTYLGLGSAGNAEGYASVSSLATLVFMVLGLALGGVLLGCIFLAPLGQAVREKVVNVPTLVRDLPGLWLRFSAYLGVLVIAGTVIGIPVALVVGLVTAFSPILAFLVALLAIGGVFLVIIHLFLADEAVIVGGAGPIAAIKESSHIVGRHFWSVLGLFLLVSIISLGLDLIWGRVASTTVGTWGAIIGSGFIATGLAASVMIYYWGRRPYIAGTALSQTENPSLSASEKDG